MKTTKKPWPSDTVILVCASPEEALKDIMESVNPGNCRECGVELVADGRSLRRSARPDMAAGRPVELMCIACAMKYDPTTIEKFIDHRNGGEIITIIDPSRAQS